MKKVSFFFTGLLLASPLQAALVIDITGSSKSTIIEASFSGEATVDLIDVPDGVSVEAISIGGRVVSDSEAISMNSTSGYFSYEIDAGSDSNAGYGYTDSDNNGLTYYAFSPRFEIYDNSLNGDDAFFLQMLFPQVLDEGDVLTWFGSLTIDLADYGESWDMFKEGSYQLENYGVDIPTVVNIIDLHPGQGHAYGQGGKPKEASALTSTLSYSVQAVPEPGTSTLLVLSALGLCLCRRR